MRTKVTTTPTRTPSTGVICTRTARDDAENSKNIIFMFAQRILRRTRRKPRYVRRIICGKMFLIEHSVWSLQIVRNRVSGGRVTNVNEMINFQRETKHLPNGKTFQCENFFVLCAARSVCSLQIFIKNDKPQTFTCLYKRSWHCFHPKLVRVLTHALQIVWRNLNREKVGFGRRQREKGENEKSYKIFTDSCG